MRHESNLFIGIILLVLFLLSGASAFEINSSYLTVQAFGESGSINSNPLTQYSNLAFSKGPSCGQLGTSLGYTQSVLSCQQKNSCPSGYTSLGTTYDCVTCCVEKAKTSASKGASCSPGYNKGYENTSSGYYYCEPSCATIHGTCSSLTGSKFAISKGCSKGYGSSLYDLSGCENKKCYYQLNCQSDNSLSYYTYSSKELGSRKCPKGYSYQNYGPEYVCRKN